MPKIDHYARASPAAAGLDDPRVLRAAPLEQVFFLAKTVQKACLDPKEVARGQDCRQFHFDVRNKSISFKEFLLLIFDFYSTSCAIIRW